MKIYKGREEIALFSTKMVGKKVLLICDQNTDPFAMTLPEPLCSKERYCFATAHLLPEISNLNGVLETAKQYTYLLAIASDIASLPSVEEIESLYTSIGLPTRFSDVGVNRALLQETVENAYTVRDRFTVMSLFHEKNMLTTVAPLLAERFA